MAANGILLSTANLKISANVTLTFASEVTSATYDLNEVRPVPDMMKCFALLNVHHWYSSNFTNAINHIRPLIEKNCIGTLR